jgi:rRNA-processing protein FCF1
VLEGAARDVPDLPTHPLLQVVRAERDGDAAVAELAGKLAGPGDRVLVVTADRALRDRVRAVGAEVVGPSALYDALPGGHG